MGYKKRLDFGKWTLWKTEVRCYVPREANKG